MIEEGKNEGKYVESQDTIHSDLKRFQGFLSKSPLFTCQNTTLTLLHIYLHNQNSSQDSSVFSVF